MDMRFNDEIDEKAYEDYIDKESNSSASYSNPKILWDGIDPSSKVFCKVETLLLFQQRSSIKLASICQYSVIMKNLIHHFPTCYAYSVKSL